MTASFRKSFTALCALCCSASAVASVSVATSSELWPKVSGVATVYYYIEPASGDVSNLSTAISTFNGDFSGVIQWVQLESVGSGSPNYVDINLNAGDSSGQCEANEGYEAMQGQPMGGSGTCTVTTILHEMGHVIGLWHEMTRSDAAASITVNYANNVIKGSWGNFQIDLQDHQLLTPFDYASVMEYPPFVDSRNGGPVIESIPAGIPMQGTEGVPAGTAADYSAADKEAIERLYGAAPTAVTVTSNPVGLQVIVDGETVTTPQTYNWTLGSTHTLDVAAGVQTLTGDIENSTTSATFYYTYGRWNDSTVQSHTITVAPGNGSPAFPVTSPQVATYSANFIQVVPYTAAVYPTGDGTVSVSPAAQTYSGASGSFFVAREKVTLTATPASGWSFYEFNNGPFWLPGGLGANPKSFYVPDTGNPVDTTAEFSNMPVYTVNVSPNPFSSNLYAYVDGKFWYVPKNFSYYYDNYEGSDWPVGSSHTIDVDTLESPYSLNSRYAYSRWSDGRAQSHSITLPGTSASYTATLTPEYAPATNFNYPPCGGTATLMPNSPTGDGFYPTGQVLTYTPTPDSGWTFAGWTYDLTGTANPGTLTASSETLVFANFNTTDTPLTLTSMSPGTVNAGSASFTLTINGTGFTAESLVSVDGQYLTPTFVSSTKLQVTVPASAVAAPATFQVYVENYPSGWDGCAVFGYDTFVVAKPIPTITWPTPAAITYGTALGTAQLDATANLPGTFAYTPAKGTILGAGAQTLSVTFTPSDSALYSPVSSTVTLTVNQRVPHITWPTPSPITYGVALGSAELDASSGVAGTFAYTPAKGTILGAGMQTLSTTFTPTDTTDYTTTTDSVTLTVNQRVPHITWPTPAAITYPTPLSGKQLDATSAVAGTFVYTPAAGTVLSAGTHTLSVTMTPTDTTDYTTATATVTLTVNP